MWTLYDHPHDDPKHYVARLFKIVPGVKEPVATTDTMRHTDLRRLRDEMLRRGLHCIKRSPQDDPVIIETWL